MGTTGNDGPVTRWRDERGQVLIIVTIAMTSLLTMVGLVLDIGNGLFIQSPTPAELQVTFDEMAAEIEVRTHQSRSSFLEDAGRYGLWTRKWRLPRSLRSRETP